MLPSSRSIFFGAALSLSAVAAQASSFACITGNGACAQAEAAISWSFAAGLLTITNAGPFVANNTGPVVTDIYFETVDANFSSSSGPLVSYTKDALPGNLPGGNTVSFVESASFSPTPPPSQDGVNPGESITFSIVGAEPFRVGVHVQALNGGLSESLVSTVPEPEAYGMALAGMLIVGMMMRRRKS
jgi:hypothetical protein